MSAPPVYPTPVGIDIRVIWRPRAFNFKPQQHASGREVLIGASQYPLHEFELIYNMLRNDPTDVEFQTFMAFFLQLGGSLTGFSFLNPYDNAVTANNIGTGDGTTTTFTLTRTYSGGGFSATEPIGYLNTGNAFNVYVNGVLQTITTNYTINQTSPGAQSITFVTAPTSGQSITIDASYYYFCRFSADTLDFEQILYNIFQIKKVTLLSKRGPS